MSLTRLLLLPALALLASCTGLPERPTLPALDATAEFAAPVPGAAAPSLLPWWRRALTDGTGAAVESALATNPGLREAAQQVDAAEAQLEQAQAGLAPTASLEGDARRQDDRRETTDSLQLGVDARVPLDVSGALSDRRDAARFRLVTQRALLAQRRNEVARDYLLALIDSREATERSRLLAQQIEVAGTLLRLIELRFAQGIASSVDVLQQRDQRAALRQQVPIAARDRWTAENRLRRLAGRTPGLDIATLGNGLPQVGEDFMLVAPTTLVETRADLRASAASVAAADADFAAALADRLPTLSLSGGALRRVIEGDYSTLLSAALSAAFTLFDGGRLRAVAGQRRAELAAIGERHLANWLDAVFEVDDLLFEVDSLRERLRLSRERLASAEQLLDAATRRYKRGVSDYLPVLEALRSLQLQQRADLALRAELQRARARLHHALGDPIGAAPA